MILRVDVLRHDYQCTSMIDFIAAKGEYKLVVGFHAGGESDSQSVKIVGLEGFPATIHPKQSLHNTAPVFIRIGGRCHAFFLLVSSPQAAGLSTAMYKS
jgi:hypothetical protein